MSVLEPGIPVYRQYPDAPPSVIGSLDTGLTVTIELWKDGEAVVLASGDDECPEIGDTGKYMFPTGKLPKMTATREQYHYRMTGDDASTDEGDFILEAVEIGVMPSLNDRQSFIAAP